MPDWGGGALMLDAIHTGLTYGLIAGFGVIGCSLTLMLLWGLLEVIAYIHSVWNDFRGDSNECKRGNNR
jgi:hypothetical protein